jgi:hypothetical protein
MKQKIKCFFGFHDEIHKIEELGFNFAHTFECPHCGKILGHFCIPKVNPFQNYEFYHRIKE